MCKRNEDVFFFKKMYTTANETFNNINLFRETIALKKKKHLVESYIYNLAIMVWTEAWTLSNIRDIKRQLFNKSNTTEKRLRQLQHQETVEQKYGLRVKKNR